MMRFYGEQRRFYCGIDLHASKMYVCVLDDQGTVVLHRNMRTEPEALKRALAPYRESVVVGAECMFSWYWVADWCREEGVEFVLGHALYMKAIHGGKAKNDRIDSEKIARLLRGGTFPLAHAYPKEMRGTRDLLRRRNLFVRRRAELLAHVQNTFTQYNVPTASGKGRDRLREGDVGLSFEDPSVQVMLNADIEVIERLDETITDLETHVRKHAKVHDPARLVACAKESAGKKQGSSGRKIGNAHLKWAFSEAAALMIRSSPEAKAFMEKMTRQRGKGPGCGARRRQDRQGRLLDHEAEAALRRPAVLEEQPAEGNAHGGRSRHDALTAHAGLVGEPRHN
jgi:transposase